MEKQLTDHEKTVIQKLLNSGQKVDAIKFIRKTTGLNLQDSEKLSKNFIKDSTAIDRFENNIHEYNRFETKENTKILISDELNESEMNFVLMLIQKNQKVNAINYVKDRLKTDIKSAKSFIDSLTVDFDSADETKLIELDENESAELDENTNELSGIESSVSDIIKPGTKKAERNKYFPSEPIVFAKMLAREKNRRPLNSGCMLIFSIFFFVFILIISIVF